MRELYKLWRGGAGLTAQDLDRVSALAEATQIQKAKLGTERTEDTKARSNQTAWLNDPWLKERLWRFTEEANRRAFSFDVTRCCDVQYTEYHASESGHYNWHIDVAYASDVPFDRKISLTVQLSDPSDYEGGEFGISRVDLPEWHKEKGTVLAFPSYILHKVAPVTKGVRRSLVAWFEGPRWR